MTTTSRVKKRRDRLRAAGWRIIQVELSPEAAAAIDRLRDGGRRTQSEVVEAAIHVAEGRGTKRAPEF